MDETYLFPYVLSLSILWGAEHLETGEMDDERSEL